MLADHGLPAAVGLEDGFADTGTLGRVLHRPAVIPMPGIVLRLALGEVADVVLDGQHVTPARALASGFTFRFPELEPALRALLL